MRRAGYGRIMEDEKHIVSEKDKAFPFEKKFNLAQRGLDLLILNGGFLS